MAIAEIDRKRLDYFISERTSGPWGDSFVTLHLADEMERIREKHKNVTPGNQAQLLTQQLALARIAIHAEITRRFWTEEANVNDWSR